MDAPGASAPSSSASHTAQHGNVVIKEEADPQQPTPPPPKAGSRSRKKDSVPGGDESSKRRCVSTACIACRRRKSKCDGNLPACAACSSVYNTECVYDPNSDHRRKGVYRKDIDKLKTRGSTLEVLIQAILNLPEEDVEELVKKIRTCDSLDAVAEGILAKQAGNNEDEEDDALLDDKPLLQLPTLESQLSGRIGELRLEYGSTRYIGGTSNLLHLGSNGEDESLRLDAAMDEKYHLGDSVVTSWTTVTTDVELINHLLNMYFTWHYPFFTTLSKTLFFRDFKMGNPPGDQGRKYCTSLLVNAMLALGCHFTAWQSAREDPEDGKTTGEAFFREAKRLLMVNDDHEKPRLTTVQALALMSVREAGCGREAKGWVYSGMSFRMACDLGLNLDSGALPSPGDSGLSDEDIDARRITFWGCFLFDKCWSNYLGRLPQLPPSIVNVPKFEIWPDEESELWTAYTDSGINQSHAQPARTRAVALQITALCEISNDLMNNFYNPMDVEKTKGKQSELKKLSNIHQRLETWRRELPQEMEPKEGCLPSVLVMHMFFQLLYIHLFRPFLKYSLATSPLPPNVSPRRLCTQAAAAISKLLRLYKRSYGLRQIPNIVVYIAHSACTIHILNLPDKNAKRDITHGVKHMEEIAECWLCARRTLAILSVLSKKWKAELPEEAAAVLSRAEARFGFWTGEAQTRTPSQKANSASPASQPTSPVAEQVSRAPQRTAGINIAYPSIYGRTFASSVAADIVAVSNTASQPIVPATTSAVSSHIPGLQATLHVSTPLAFSLSPSPTAYPATASISAPNTISGAVAGLTNPASGVLSPTASFGGFEPLLRESQDWWLRDQSQLALGFDQWPMNPSEYQDSQSWHNSMNPTAAPTASSAGAFAGLSPAWDTSGMNPMEIGPRNVPPQGNDYSNDNEWYRQRMSDQ